MKKRALLLSLLILLLCLSGVALAEEEQPADPASLLLGGQTLTGEEREEFLNAPWMIGAVNGMIGGFEKQESYFQKSYLARKQKTLTASLAQAQGRAEDQALDAMQRRQAALEAEEIQKQLTAAENQLYELNGKKRYSDKRASEAVKGLGSFDGKQKDVVTNWKDSSEQQKAQNPHIREVLGLEDKTVDSGERSALMAMILSDQTHLLEDELRAAFDGQWPFKHFTPGDVVQMVKEKIVVGQ